jgi:hypothetical protein
MDGWTNLVPGAQILCPGDLLGRLKLVDRKFTLVGRLRAQNDGGHQRCHTVLRCGPTRV